MAHSAPNPANQVYGQSKLADGRWRLRNSWWIWPPVLSLGFLCWLGFLVAGIRTSEKKYYIASAFYATSLFTFFVMTSIFSEDTLGNSLAGIPLFTSWLGATVHAAILNRSYLRTLANQQQSWYERGPTAGPHQDQVSPSGSFLGVAGGDFYGPASSSTTGPVPSRTRTAPAPSEGSRPPGAGSSEGLSSSVPSGVPLSPMDVNVGTATDLASLPGVHIQLAERIVVARDERGGFRDLDDLARATGLQPHEMARLRGHLVFSRSAPHPGTSRNRPEPGAGRILDI